MKLYVGITDGDWFKFLRARNADEMNFWRPRGSNNFGAINPGELFLFKSRYPENRIIGGAYFVRHTTLPLDLAWEVFKETNGVESRDAFRRKISSIRGDNERNPVVGCTVLTQPFYLRDGEYLPAPTDWGRSIVTGKSYDVSYGEGAKLWANAKLAMAGDSLRDQPIPEQSNRYGNPQLFAPRLGQGGFRVVVMEGYQRRCAVTGEKTLPVLEAAHIRPYADEGPHTISNGIFLRSDLHTLFDRGYITITNDYHVAVSRRIRDEFSNGREYYALEGKALQITPQSAADRPSKEFLEWHQNNCFRLQ
jgi:putative restriction endonuclease